MVELCCGHEEYHFNCAAPLVHGGKLFCPKCRRNIPFPVVYSNSYNLQHDCVLYPLTFIYVPNDQPREVRNQLIDRADYVYLNLDRGDYNILGDLNYAISTGKRTYLHGFTLSCVSTKVNQPVCYGSRQHRMEAAMRDEFLEPQLSHIIKFYNEKGPQIPYPPAVIIRSLGTPDPLDCAEARIACAEARIAGVAAGMARLVRHLEDGSTLEEDDGDAEDNAVIILDN